MSLVRDRRGAAALEFALVSPVVLLFVFGLFATYDLVMAKRAMDVGVEKALRYAVVNNGGAVGDVTGVYTNWAGLISSAVGARSNVTVTSNPLPSGVKITVSASYAWGAPASLGGSLANPIFGPVTLNSQATMRVMH